MRTFGLLGELFLWELSVGFVLLLPPSVGAVSIAALSILLWRRLLVSHRAMRRIGWDVGLRRPHRCTSRLVLAVLMLPVAYIAATAAYARVAPSGAASEYVFLTKYEASPYGWAGSFILASVFAPLVEEFAFRGVILHGLWRRYGRAVALVGSALAFSFAHLTLWRAWALFAYGYGAGLLVMGTGSVWPGIAAHSLTNAAWIVFDLLVRHGILTDLQSSSYSTWWLVAVAVLSAALFVGAISGIDSAGAPCEVANIRHSSGRALPRRFAATRERV